MWLRKGYGLPPRVPLNNNESVFAKDIALISIKCLEKLETHDVVSVEYLSRPQHHMSGNFWWATSNHISKLNVPHSNARRHKFEFFILNTKKYTKILSFHQRIDTSDFQGFNKNGRRRYLLSDYKESDNGKLFEINKS